MSTILINKIDEIRIKISEWKKAGFTIGLVPTMGALHSGHESLIEAAKSKCDKVVVSIFVNPTQFGPNEDFDKYPRTIDSDKVLLDRLAVDFVFAPLAEEMYESSHSDNNNFTFVYPPYSFVDKLCGKTRTGHFDGVATVVLKLFNIVQPDLAFFGQKDAQQFIIISKMVKDLNVPVELVQCPTVREESGLALSSRNKYLTQDERQKAISISKSLFYVQELYSKGISDKRILFDEAMDLLDKTIDVEYLEFVDSKNLEPVEQIKGLTLVAIAVKVGRVRLIDNIIIG